ncbi:hypothetical protein ACHAXN_002006 [Cyclotella atomus]
MGTQFIVRSQDNKFALKLRTVLYDGVEMIRLRENDIAIFEFDDPDVVVELVVRKKTRSSSGERSGRGKSSSGESLQVAAAADRDNSDGIANLAVAALNNSAAEEAKKPVTIPRKPTAKQTEDHQKPIECVKNNQDTASKASQIRYTTFSGIRKLHESTKERTQASLWNERFNELQEYKRQHGNCRVPRKYSNTLHHWVDQQRKYFREGKIHQDRLQRLNEIGFSWNACESRWSLRYSQLMLFKKRFGHCRVPQKYAENPQLAGEWVIQQRKEFRNGKITEERIAKLNELDFTWDGRSSSGERKSLNAGEVCYEFGEHEDGWLRWRSDGLLWRAYCCVLPKNNISRSSSGGR